MSQTSDDGEVVIRRAVTRDVPAIAECVRSTGEPDVSRLDGSVVAVAVLIVSGEGALRGNVAAHPAVQVRGLGRRMIELAETEACRQGHHETELYTHVLVVESVAPHERLGCEEIDRRTERGFERTYLRSGWRRRERRVDQMSKTASAMSSTLATTAAAESNRLSQMSSAVGVRSVIRAACAIRPATNERPSTPM